MKKFLLISVLIGFLMVWQEPFPSGNIVFYEYENLEALHFDLLDLVPHPSRIKGIWDIETGRKFKVIIKSHPIIEFEPVEE